MIKFKQSVAATIPVRLIDPSTFQPVTGVASGSVAVALSKAAAAAAAITIDGVTNTWVEDTTGAFTGQGFYRLGLGSGNFDTLGALVVAVSGSTGRACLMVQVVSALEADLASATNQTAIKAKTDNLPATPASQGDVTGARDSVKGASAKDLTQVFTEVDTRLAAAAYTEPDNAGIANAAARAQRALGLAGAFRKMEVLTVDGSKRPLTARIRLWDSAAHRAAAGATGLLGTYNATFTWADDGTGTMDTDEVLP